MRIMMSDVLQHVQHKTLDIFLSNIARNNEIDIVSDMSKHIYLRDTDIDYFFNMMTACKNVSTHKNGVCSVKEKITIFLLDAYFQNDGTAKIWFSSFFQKTLSSLIKYDNATLWYTLFSHYSYQVFSEFDACNPHVQRTILEKIVEYSQMHVKHTRTNLLRHIVYQNFDLQTSKRCKFFIMNLELILLYIAHTKDVDGFFHCLSNHERQGHLIADTPLLVFICQICNYDEHMYTIQLSEKDDQEYHMMCQLFGHTPTVTDLLNYRFSEPQPLEIGTLFL